MRTSEAVGKGGNPNDADKGRGKQLSSVDVLYGQPCIYILQSPPSTDQFAKQPSTYGAFDWSVKPIPNRSQTTAIVILNLTQATSTFEFWKYAMLIQQHF